MALSHRYDFLVIFDVQDGNPNGDPDAGNLPRIDPETGHGLVTDVCIKRKIRNYVLLSKTEPGFDIYVKEKSVLGRAHVQAFEELKIELGTGARQPVPSDLVELFATFELPDGLSLAEENEGQTLVVAADADLKEIKVALKEAPTELKTFIEGVTKKAKPRKPTGGESDKGRKFMCERYFDVRTFGAVMSLKSAPNCGQVRGPVQLTFSRSVDPIVQLEHSITRMAVAREDEAEKERTMGRKATVPYGLYVCRGFVSPSFAQDFVEKGSELKGGTGFSETDLALVWEALDKMFENDRSAARGLMSTRRLFVFEHESLLGNARAADLFDLIKIERNKGVEVPRSFTDYKVSFPPKTELPHGVHLKTPGPSSTNKTAEGHPVYELLPYPPQ
jgi:CRISPR-associated protein Csd2